MNVMVSRVIDKSDDWNTIFKLYGNDSGDPMDILLRYLQDSDIIYLDRVDNIDSEKGHQTLNIFKTRSLPTIFESYQNKEYRKYIDAGLELSHFFGMYQDQPDITSADVDVSQFIESITNKLSIDPRDININTGLGLTSIFGLKILDQYILLDRYKGSYNNSILDTNYLLKSKYPKVYEKENKKTNKNQLPSTTLKTKINIMEKKGYFEDIILPVLEKELRKMEYSSSTMPVHNAIRTLMSDFEFVYLRTQSDANKSHFKRCELYDSEFKRMEKLFNHFEWNIELSEGNFNKIRDGVKLKKIYTLTPPEKDDKQIIDETDNSVPFSKVGGGGNLKFKITT